MASSAQRIPAMRIRTDLGELGPGPELSSALSQIELSRLCHTDLIEVLQAQYRQTTHERAKLLAAMAETGLCDFGPDDQVRRLAGLSSFCADEVRAALVLTRTAAEAGFWLAYDLRHRLPAVFAAMLAGRCDEPRARIFSDWTAELDPAVARGVCATLLPRVGELTTGQLIEAIKTRAVALDPDWARHRYEQAVARRKVVARRNHDGSANLSGYDLPVDRVAMAAARIDALAKTAKAAGDSRSMDYIRAELFLGMTDGSYVGLGDEEILAELATARMAGAGAEAAEERAGAEAKPGGGAEPGAEAKPSTEAEPSAEAKPGRDGERTVHGEPSTDAAPDADDQPVPAETTGEPGAPPSGATPSGAAHGRAPGRGTDAPATRRALELRVCLSTLLGGDQRPGELAGWGPIHAELARNLAGDLVAGQWRYVLTDEAGYLAHTGLLSARPTGAGHLGSASRSAGRAAGRAADVVEVAVRLVDLPALAEPLAGGDYPGWATLIAELARRASEHAVDTEATPPQVNAVETTRRLPGAALRRQLEVRDRRCRGVGCRVPASSADLDHTHDHASGGPTTDSNLGALCRHDHRLKHEGGWHLDQPEPGFFVWTSRLGQRYVVRPRPVIEALPEPIARDTPLPPVWVREDYGADRPILDDVEPEPERGPPAGQGAPVQRYDLEPPF